MKNCEILTFSNLRSAKSLSLSDGHRQTVSRTSISEMSLGISRISWLWLQKSPVASRPLALIRTDVFSCGRGIFVGYTYGPMKDEEEVELKRERSKITQRTGGEKKARREHTAREGENLQKDSLLFPWMGPARRRVDSERFVRCPELPLLFLPVSSFPCVCMGQRRRRYRRERERERG